MVQLNGKLTKASSLSLVFIITLVVLTSCVSVTLVNGSPPSQGQDSSPSPSPSPPLETRSDQPGSTRTEPRSPVRPTNPQVQSSISRRIMVPQGNFGPVLPEAQIVAGSQQITNPGFRVRISQDELVVGVSLLPEPRVGAGVHILQPGLVSEIPWSSITDRTQRSRLEGQINGLLQVDLIPGRPVVLELKDEGSRLIEIIPSALEVPSFFRSILVLLAEGLQPRIAVLPSEFTLVQNQNPGPDHPLVSLQAQEAFLNRTTGLLEDLVLLAGGALADRREVNRVLLETDLSVSELFSTEGILPFGSRIPADYGLIFAVQVFQTPTQSDSNNLDSLDMIVRLVKIPEGTIEAVYRERVTNF